MIAYRRKSRDISRGVANGGGNYVAVRARHQPNTSPRFIDAFRRRLSRYIVVLLFLSSYIYASPLFFYPVAGHATCFVSRVDRVLCRRWRNGEKESLRKKPEVRVSMNSERVVSRGSFALWLVVLPSNLFSNSAFRIKGPTNDRFSHAIAFYSFEISPLFPFLFLFSSDDVVGQDREITHTENYDLDRTTRFPDEEVH